MSKSSTKRMQGSQLTAVDRPRVLIVDDLADNRVAFEAILRREDFEVDLAESANDALGLLVDRSYICVLCDVQMPEIDGIEFARIVRADADIAGLPILFITAHDYSPETLSDAFGVDAYDFIRKPIDPVILRSKLRVFLQLELQRRDLAQQAFKLHEANLELEQFARIASHDLRSPLRAIKALAEALEEDFGEVLPQEGRRTLQMLFGRAVRMGHLLDDLMSYARVGRQAGQIGTRAFRNMVEDVIELVELPDHIRVTVEHGADVEITGFLTPLGTCIRNLVSNAVKHHDKDQGQVLLSCERDAASYRVTVADDGPGIAEKDHELIFQMFTTLAPRDVVEGSGLGLSIVKRTLESFGGEIQLSSDVGQGTRFEMTWPATPEASQP